MRKYSSVRSALARNIVVIQALQNQSTYQQPSIAYAEAREVLSAPAASHRTSDQTIRERTMRLTFANLVSIQDSAPFALHSILHVDC